MASAGEQGVGAVLAPPAPLVDSGISDSGYSGRLFTDVSAEIEHFLASGSGIVPAAAGWRVEFTHKGKYWHYRRGSGEKREYQRGGKSNVEKRAEYAARKARNDA